MDEYRDYLKDAIVVQRTVVSYRLLSRALKVHVNQAKEMLFDYYTSENAIKPKSVHATYIVIGYRKPQVSSDKKEGVDDDNDTVMFDSSFLGTQNTATAGEEGEELVRIVELCQEEELDAVKGGLEKVSSIHLYSLEQVRLEDFTILTGCSAKVVETHQSEDPLDAGATYGIALNPRVKRTGNRASPPVSEPRRATVSVGQEKRRDLPVKKEVLTKKEATAKKKEVKLETKDDSEVNVETKERRPAGKASTLPTTKTTSSAAVKPKRGQSNDIFSSWKAAPKKTTTDPVSGSNSAAQTPKMEEDVGSDIDESDKESANEKSQTPIHDDAEYVRKRKEKEQELRNMMDEEEDEEDIKMEDEEPPAKMVKVEKPEPNAPTGLVTGVTTSGGRVRGKRKVSKKVQSRDSDGYLVTKMEYVWESFSDDEPEPPKPKPVVKPVAKGKKGKDGQSKGQGNLMSYFAKK